MQECAQPLTSIPTSTRGCVRSRVSVACRCGSFSTMRSARPAPGERRRGAALRPAFAAARPAPGHQCRQGARARRRAGGRGDPAQARAAQVKLPDVNLLLYGIDEDSPRHQAARAWVEDPFGGTETVALAWAVMLAFVRLTTKPQVMARPFTVEEALDIARAGSRVRTSSSCTPRTATRTSCASSWRRRHRRQPHDRRPPRRTVDRARRGAVLERRRFLTVPRRALAGPVR